MTIEVDVMKAIVMAEWLQRMFAKTDKSARNARTKGDVIKVARMEGEYAGAREALGILGIQVRFDRQTKRPLGIEKR